MNSLINELIDRIESERNRLYEDFYRLPDYEKEGKLTSYNNVDTTTPVSFIAKPYSTL